MYLIKSIFRSHVCKTNLDENQKVDYIYCLCYSDNNSDQTNIQPFEVTDTTISCSLEQRQRSSQQILDLADYLKMHQSEFPPIRRWSSGHYQFRETPISHWKHGTSFSSDIPLWVELSNPKAFFYYFKDKFESDDVMLIWDRSNLSFKFNDIKEFCKDQKWRCTERLNVRGSEASVTILYDFNQFFYEYFTRAKTQLVIVTIEGKPR